MIIFRLEEWLGLLVGAAYGLMLFWINFYGFTEVFPWFAEARNWVTGSTHIIFGVAAAWIYKEMAKREIRHEVGSRETRSS